MTERFYRILMVLARMVGDWSFLLIAWFVATGYFLFFPRRVAVSYRFYCRLFPGEGGSRALWRTWRQYHRFVHVFLDRFRLARGDRLPVTCEGWEHIIAAAQSGKGAVLVMSHLGSWEIAAMLLMMSQGEQIPGLKLLLYLGEKRQEEIEGLQKRSVAARGIRVVAVPETGGSALDMIEGLHFLKQGGLVSLTGDRLWGQGQRTVNVRFAGGLARIPEMPYVLAMLAGAPLLVFFGYGRDRQGYHLAVKPPLTIAADRRAERGQLVQEAAQTYADWLAETVRRHPGEWFHFTPFLRDPAGEGKEGT